MAVDPGVLDSYLDYLQGQIEDRQNQAGRLKDSLWRAQIEDSARAAITAADDSVLVAADLVPIYDSVRLQQQIAELQSVVQALRHLRSAAKALA